MAKKNGKSSIKIMSFNEAYSKIKKNISIHEEAEADVQQEKPAEIKEAASLYEQENVFTFVYSIAAALGIQKIKMEAADEDAKALVFVCDSTAEAKKLGETLKTSLKNLKSIDIEDVEDKGAEAITFTELIKNVTVDDKNVVLEV